MKMSWRRFSSSSSEDVLIKTDMFAAAIGLQKTSWSRPIYSFWPYVKTSSRRFQDVFKTSSKCLQDVLVKTSIFVLANCLQDVCKTFLRRLAKKSSRRFEDVLKTSWSIPIYLCWLDVFKTYSRRLQNIFKTSSRRLQDVFKKFWRRL